MKNSIRKKINILIMISIAVVSFVMIVINLVIINRYTDEDSETMMANTCFAKAMELDNQFQLVEQTVHNIYDISETIRPSLGELKSSQKTDAFIKEFQEIAVAMANNTEGAITVYYRINPELNINGKEGFFYVKSPDTGRFEPNEITDLLQYDSNDIEHVGWYYIPVKAGKPMWMEPYYNANIWVEMISYVVPIFDGTNLIGVVGMDIDFDRLKAMTEDINMYDSGGAVLASMESDQIYYSDSYVLGNQLPKDLKEILQKEDDIDKMLKYNINGIPYGVYYKTLKNNMKLIIYAEESEIHKQSNTFIFVSVIISAVSIMLTLVVATRMTGRLVAPIINITEATKQYTQGNWDAEVTCNTHDELKVLADNISSMAESTKQYIGYIKDIAKKDALTGLRNKTAYMLYVEKINAEYIENRKDFAIVVFDVNNLKYVNDNYGHEKGDELLVAASKLICNRFSHSPVFRIGGDEFVAILDSDDYQNRMEIMEEFKHYMWLAKDSADDFEVCIAAGMAEFGRDGENFDDLFDNADRKMYKHKRELKNGRQSR